MQHRSYFVGARRLSQVMVASALLGGAAFCAPALAQDELFSAATAGGKVRVIVEYKTNAPSPVGAAGFGELATRSARLNTAHASFLSSVGRTMSDPDVSAMPLTPQVAMSVTAAELTTLRANPMVASVQADGVNRPLLSQSTVIMKAPYAWARSGSGFGWSVAVLDTGSNAAHEFLARGGTSEACYSSRFTFNFNGLPVTVSSQCPGGVTASTAFGSARDCNANQVRGCGHGTHVAGIALGSNTSPSSGEPMRGMAYRANLISINVFSRHSANYCNAIGYSTNSCLLAYDSDIIRGLQRVLALSIAGRKVASINISIGGGRFTSSCNSSPIRASILALRARNIATVIAAGNSGYSNAVSSPACISEAITVASSTKSGALSSFTNWSSLVDIVATGSDIKASYRVSTNTMRHYANLSGTSMAAPHVAGYFAMMKSRFPSATVTLMESAIKTCGPTMTRAGVGRKRLDLECAYKRLDALLP